MRLFTLFWLLCFNSLASATILPPNDLHEEDNPRIVNNITEEEFNLIIDEIAKVYEPIIASHGANLVIQRLWSNSTVNANAQRMGKRWIVNMYGGLARRPEVTKDGFALVVCHELGHHLAGFPYKPLTWAANEGQSDYFATQACARKIWQSQTEINAQFRQRADETIKLTCNNSWHTQGQQDLCYRIAAAGQSLGSLLARLRKDPDPSVETPDTERVGRTANSHPAAQCRFDTYLAGAQCPVDFDDNRIPGSGKLFKNSRKVELQAMQVSCSRELDQFPESARPRCWFRPRGT